MIILGIYTMRKRGLSFSAAARQAKNNIMGRRPDPPPKQASGWMDNKRPYRDEYNDAVTPPQQAATIARSGSITSQRPLMAMQRSDRYVHHLLFITGPYGLDLASYVRHCLRLYYLHVPFGEHCIDGTFALTPVILQQSRCYLGPTCTNPLTA